MQLLNLLPSSTFVKAHRQEQTQNKAVKGFMSIQKC